MNSCCVILRQSFFFLFVATVFHLRISLYASYIGAFSLGPLNAVGLFTQCHSSFKRRNYILIIFTLVNLVFVPHSRLIISWYHLRDLIGVEVVLTRCFVRTHA